MTDFETHPVGTAARLKALETAPVVVMTLLPQGLCAFGCEDFTPIYPLQGKRVRLVLVEG